MIRQRKVGAHEAPRSEKNASPRTDRREVRVHSDPQRRGEGDAGQRVRQSGGARRPSALTEGPSRQANAAGKSAVPPRRESAANPQSAPKPQSRKSPPEQESAAGWRTVTPAPGKRPARKQSADAAERARKKAVLRQDERERALRKKSRSKWFLLATVLAVLALAAFAMWHMAQSKTDEYSDSMDQARESYQSRDYETALRYLRRAAPLEQGDEVRLLMADCYEAQGNLDKALEILRAMNVTQSAVTERIERIDRQRTALQEAEKVTVFGLRFDAGTTDLVLDGQDVRDNELPQLQQLYALDNLSLMNNRITDITALAKLGGLDTLNLSGNQIEDISPLAELPGLRTLYLDDNPISDFTPLYGLERLNTLSIRGIPLTGEQLSALSQALPGCAIHSDGAVDEAQTAADITIGGFSFKSDVQELDLSGRGIRDIGALAECGQLRYLRLRDNEIADLTALMNLQELANLDVSGNGLSDLRPLMGMSNLTTLTAADNELMDTAALGSMSELRTLNLSGNAITDFTGLGKLKKLEVLDLSNTGITDEDLPILENLVMLRSLNLEGNEGLGNDAMGHLKSMLPTCTILHSDLIYTAVIGGKEYGSNLTELDVQGQNLTDLGNIDRLGCLETVNFSQNQLSNIYLLQYSGSRDTIRSLNLSYNQIMDISPLAAMTALEELDLSGNPVTTLQPLTHVATLKSLRLVSCGLAQEKIDSFREERPDVTLILE